MAWIYKCLPKAPALNALLPDDRPWRDDRTTDGSEAEQTTAGHTLLCEPSQRAYF